MCLEKKAALAGLGIALISLLMPWAYNNLGDRSIPYYTAVYSTALVSFSPLLGAGIILSFAGGVRGPAPRRASITAIIFCVFSGLLMMLFAIMFVTKDWTPVGYVLQVFSLLMLIYSATRAIRHGSGTETNIPSRASHA